MAFIEVRSLSKSYGTVKALDGLSFQAERGQVTGLIGRNGAGKSTALRIVLGLVHPDAGEATVDGVPYAELVEPLRTIGAVAEDVRFHPRRSGRDHLRIVARAAGVSEDGVEPMLELTELSTARDRAVGGYSLGMRQRLGLAAALLPDPSALVLDEPMNGLDPVGVRWLRRLLRSEADRGRAVLISSHLLSELAVLVDHVVVIERGRLVTQSSSASLLGEGGAEAQTEQVDDLLRALAEAGVVAEQIGADRVLAPGASARALGRIAADHGIALTALTTRRESLEDAFMGLTFGEEQ